MTPTKRALLQESIMAEQKFDTASEFLAHTLRAYGVTHIFYMETMLRESMVQMEQLGIARVLAHSEKAAAYMADGYARAARRPGVCIAQSVGAANLAAGLQEPRLSRSPVVALTGKKLGAYQHRNAYQELPHSFFQPVTKFSAHITEAAQITQTMRQLFREAITGVPGPVHADIPDNMGVWFDSLKGEFELIEEPRFAAAQPFRNRPEQSDVQAAASLLAASARPVIVAGGGAIASGAGEAVTLLAEKGAIPVATSADGKGTIREDHPLSVGVVGSYSRYSANKTVCEADLVLFIGCGTGDQVTHNWTLPTPGTPVIQIDINPAELGRNYPNSASLLGDARLSVEMLCAAVAPADRSGWRARAAALSAEWRTEQAEKAASGASPIRPERLCRELTEALPDDALLFCDTGCSSIWTAAMVELRKPGQRYFRPTGGSLGWSFPASLGAKCAVPDKPVICFSGDGALLYHLSELETAARRNIASVTIVNNNAGFGQCKPRVHALYGCRPGNPEDLYKFIPVNYARIAEEFGCLGIRVEKAEDLAPAIARGLAAGKPVLIDVHTDISCPPPAPWAPSPMDCQSCPVQCPRGEDRCGQ